MSYNRNAPTGNCQKCFNTFGTLGCCDTISNEWCYDCDDGMRRFAERKPPTNADRIRTMTDEELARYYAKRIVRCYGCEAATEDDCYECQIEWLKSPVEVDE